MENSNGNAATHEVYREVNKRIREVGNTFEWGANGEFLCECGQEECRETLELTQAQYDGLLGADDRVLLAIRHKGSLNGHRVLAEYDHFLVVAAAADGARSA